MGNTGIKQEKYTVNCLFAKVYPEALEVLVSENKESTK